MRVLRTNQFPRFRSVFLCTPDLTEVAEREAYDRIKHVLEQRSMVYAGSDAETERERLQEEMQQLQDAELVIAACSWPSTRVGYLLAAAENLGKKVVVLCSREREENLSNLISANPRFSLVKYPEDSLDPVLQSVLLPMLID